MKKPLLCALAFLIAFPAAAQETKEQKKANEKAIERARKEAARRRQWEIENPPAYPLGPASPESLSRLFEAAARRAIYSAKPPKNGEGLKLKVMGAHLRGRAHLGRWQTRLRGRPGPRRGANSRPPRASFSSWPAPSMGWIWSWMSSSASPRQK